MKLSDEDVCRKHMEDMRWGGAPFCPHCNSTKPYKLKDFKTYRCSNKSCRKDFTVTVGTVFENSKVKVIYMDGCDILMHGAQKRCFIPAIIP